MANTTAADWDESYPTNSSARNDGAREIRTLRAAVADRLEKEHAANAASTAGGEHKAGSAKIYRQAGPTGPTLRPDGTTSLDSNDAGRLWLDTSNNALYIHSGSAWVLLNYVDANAASFEKTDAHAVPYTQSGLQNGTWMVFVYGTVTGNLNNGDPYTASLTVNSVARTFYMSNYPDGAAPFCVPMKVTVSANQVSVSAVSNIDNIEGMVGHRISA